MGWNKLWQDGVRIGTWSEVDQQQELRGRCKGFLLPPI